MLLCDIFILRRWAEIETQQLSKFINNLDFLLENANEEQFIEHTLFLLKEAIEKKDVTNILLLVNKYIAKLIASPSRKVLEELIIKSEPIFYEEENEAFLAYYLSVKGHLHVYKQDLLTAREYYKEAISYAMKYDLYQILSTATVNYGCCLLDSLPNDVLWSCSKLGTLFHHMSEEVETIEGIGKIFLHIETALKMDKLDYADQLITKISRSPVMIANTHSRAFIQLQLAKLELLYKKNQLDDAMALGFELLLMNELKGHVDLIVYLYEKLLSLEELVPSSNRKQLLTEEYEMFLKQEVSTNEKDTPFYIRETAQTTYKFLGNAVSYEEFKELSQELISMATSNFTLVMTEILLEDYLPNRVNQILSTIDQYMSDVFEEMVISKARIQQTKLVYLIRLNEESVEHRLKVIMQRMRQVYPVEEGLLTRLILAYVNPMESGYSTYDECLQVAYAHVYYRSTRSGL